MKRFVVATASLFAAVLLVAFGVRVYAESSAGDSITLVSTVVHESYKDGKLVTNTSKQLSAISRRGSAILLRDEAAYRTVPGFHYRHLRLNDGRTVNIYDPIGIRSTIYSGDSPASFAQKFRASQCIANPQMQTLVGTEEINGVQTVKIVHGGPDREFTRWLAPSAGCFELKKIAVWKDAKTGTITGRTIYTPESITIGEPDASIFDVPAHYVEKSQNEADLARLRYRYGSIEEAQKACGKCVAMALAKDPVYERLKNPPTGLYAMRLRVRHFLGI